MCISFLAFAVLHASFFFFFFTDPATTEIYTLSLHDALPISLRGLTAVSDLAPGLLIAVPQLDDEEADRKSTRLNSSHVEISYAVFCLKKKKNTNKRNIITTTHTHQLRAPPSTTYSQTSTHST